MSLCYLCGDSYDTDFLSCVSCCNNLLYGCIHAAAWYTMVLYHGILKYSWNTSKPTPTYAIYIFECDNFSCICKSCNVNNKIYITYFFI